MDCKKLSQIKRDRLEQKLTQAKNGLSQVLAFDQILLSIIIIIIAYLAHRPNNLFSTHG